VKIKLPKIKNIENLHLKTILIYIGVITVIAGLGYQSLTLSQKTDRLKNEANNKAEIESELNKTKKRIEELESRDEYKINDELEKEIKSINTTYKKAVSTYEKLLDYKDKGEDTVELDEIFADALSKLSERDYESADTQLSTLTAKIQEKEEAIAASFEIPKSVPESNAPPGSGYSRQTVNVDGLGSYLVSIVAADISSTKVVVDTASPSDCGNDCPVLALSDYVSRNGAYAGINGTYFCPASYPSCAGKTNSFDLLLMNKDKTYFNSDNNVYSNNPGVIFGGGYIRFVSSVSQWGRDTSIDSMISNFPLLVFNDQVVFGGDDDPKKGSKGGRSFIANKGNTVYIGVVHSATVAESARVLKQLGMNNAMNLDDGGSTALWSGGYKVGPGRNLPNVILFVSK
jgi:hypothetical protein